MSSRVFSNGGGSNQQKKVMMKPFCKVCQDAGKEQHVFSSHWVKDEQGKVCCPTLLSQKCRYCDELGHTTNYCQALKKLKEIEHKMANRLASDRLAKEARNQTAAATKPLANNQWAALAAAADDDSSDDDEKPIRRIKSTATATATADFPPLSANVTLRPHQKAFGGLSSFANIAAAASHLPDPIYALQAKAKAAAAAAAAVAVTDNSCSVSFAHNNDDDHDQDQAACFVSLTAAATTAMTPKFPVFLKTLKKKASEMNWADWNDSDDDEDYY